MTKNESRTSAKRYARSKLLNHGKKSGNFGFWILFKDIFILKFMFFYNYINMLILKIQKNLNGP
jgi:hypothetical protein